MEDTTPEVVDEEVAAVEPTEETEAAEPTTEEAAA